MNTMKGLQAALDEINSKDSLSEEDASLIIEAFKESVNAMIQHHPEFINTEELLSGISTVCTKSYNLLKVIGGISHLNIWRHENEREEDSSISLSLRLYDDLTKSVGKGKKKE